jgi:hypothetical protein
MPLHYDYLKPQDPGLIKTFLEKHIANLIQLLPVLFEANFFMKYKLLFVFVGMFSICGCPDNTAFHPVDQGNLDFPWPDIAEPSPDIKQDQQETDFTPFDIPAEEEIIPQCENEQQCNDYNDCTTDKCENNVCKHIPVDSQECCVSGNQFEAYFDDGSTGDFKLESDSTKVKWQVSDYKYSSPPFSLYFGNPETKNYQTDAAVSGSASFKVNVPKSAKQAKFHFQIYLDIEYKPKYDLFRVLVYDTENPGLDEQVDTIWTKESLSKDKYKTFVPVEIPVTQYSGKAITIEFNFGSVDQYGNMGEGIYIDDISVAVSCQDTCGSDAECDDSNICTKDQCIEKQCKHEKYEGCCSSENECNDQDPCTLDKCELGINTEAPFPVCNNYKKINCCKVDEDCDDGSDCTEDSCIFPDDINGMPETGMCNFIPIPGCCKKVSDCKDNNPCTVESCAPGGLCKYSQVPDCCSADVECMDDNNCTYDYCAKSSGGTGGKCVHETVPSCCQADKECDDSNNCTKDSCISGMCVHTGITGCCMSSKDCDDNNMCTIDSCDAAAGKCAHEKIEYCCNVDSDCNDSIPCTEDKCYGGKCGFSPKPDCCTEDKHCDDNNICTMDKCVQYTCIHEMMSDCCNSDKDCDDGNVCTLDKCIWIMTGSGTPPPADMDPCQHLPITGCCTSVSECNDGNACTYDFCEANKCTHKGVPNCCKQNSDCNDKNLCTMDYCKDKTCYFEKIPSCCMTDGDCNDNNYCTTDSCLDNNCLYTFIPDCCSTGKQCDDNNPCTEDVCQYGKCVHKMNPDCCKENSDCNDNDPCTFDQCVNIGGKSYCEHVKIPDCCQKNSDCDDGSKCTEDFCMGNKCAHKPIPQCCANDYDCKDSNPCTVDKCQKMQGICVYPQIPGCCMSDEQCNDYNNCTKDKCENNSCQYVPLPNCCTNDWDCMPTEPCTFGYCMDGTCLFKKIECDDGNPCTEDICTDWGECMFMPVEGCCNTNDDCNDYNPCTIDGCKNMKCFYKNTPGCCLTSSECDDLNPCTKNVCSKNTCMFVPITGCCLKDGDCNDGDPCTADKCGVESLLCAHLAIPGCCKFNYQCDDQNVCTDDLCISNACAHKNLETACEDGNACTKSDVCKEGKCIAGQNVDCNDSNNCTEDSCDIKLGCIHKLLPNCTPLCTKDGDCNDNDNCTTDKCEGGACNHYWSPLCCKLDADCNDKNPCTDDKCKTDKTCSNIPNTIPCDDSSVCTTGDVCLNGKCTGKQTMVCNDDSVCTEDSCDPVKGCVFKKIPDCCEEKDAFFAKFDEGNAENFYLESSNALVKWTLSKKRYTSPYWSLYFGNPEAGNFNDPSGQPVSGTATGPAVLVPEGKSAVLKFNVYLDVEMYEPFDMLRTYILIAGKEPVEVWNKALVSGDKYKKFTEVMVNLSPYIGQEIRIQFAFDSVDGVENNGEGVYIDDVRITALCEILKYCNFDTECSDGNVCTKDLCKGNICYFSPIAQCCLSDKECEDNYICTNDKCVNNKCKNSLISGCCIADEECDDQNACTLDKCSGNVCMHEAVPGSSCCNLDSDCNDNDKCTLDKCVSNKCSFEQVDPTCCNQKDLFIQHFNIKSLGGFTVVDDGSDVKWQVYNSKYYDPPFALYYGNPETGNYNNGGTTYGSAVSPEISIPSYGTPVLKFWTYMDIEMGSPFDSFELRVKSGSTLATLWSKAEIYDPESYQNWIEITVDLSKYKGKTIIFRFDFSSLDQMTNEGEGVFVDAIDLKTTCP